MLLLTAKWNIHVKDTELSVVGRGVMKEQCSAMLNTGKKVE